MYMEAKFWSDCFKLTLYVFIEEINVFFPKIRAIFESNTIFKYCIILTFALD